MEILPRLTFEFRPFCPGYGSCCDPIVRTCHGARRSRRSMVGRCLFLLILNLDTRNNGGLQGAPVPDTFMPDSQAVNLAELLKSDESQGREHARVADHLQDSRHVGALHRALHGLALNQTFHNMRKTTELPELGR